MKRIRLLLFLILVVVLLVDSGITASTSTYSGTESQSPAVSTNSPPALNNSNIDQGKPIVQIAVNESPPVLSLRNTRIDSTNDLNMLTAPPSNSSVENRMNEMANASDRDQCFVATVKASMASILPMNASLLNTQTGCYEKIQMKQTANGLPPSCEKQIDSNWPMNEVAMDSAVGITSLQVTTFAIDDENKNAVPTATSELPPAANFVAGNSTNMLEAENFSWEVTRATAISRAGVMFSCLSFTMGNRSHVSGVNLVTNERCQFNWYPNIGYFATSDTTDGSFFLASTIGEEGNLVSYVSAFISYGPTRKLAPFANFDGGGDSGLTRAWWCSGV